MIAFIYLFFVVNNATINDIAEAVSIVESNRNDKAIGDNGRSYGRFQIQQCFIDDVNRVYKTNYKLSDAVDPIKAKAIVVLYWKYWGKFYEIKTNRKMALIDYARLHNSGPYWFKKKSITDSYVRKVMNNITMIYNKNK